VFNIGNFVATDHDNIHYLVAITDREALRARASLLSDVSTKLVRPAKQAQMDKEHAPFLSDKDLGFQGPPRTIVSLKRKEPS
jgi:hypothetical protein